MIPWVDDEDTRISDFFVSQALEDSSRYRECMFHEINIDRESESYVMALTEIIRDMACPLTQSIGSSFAVGSYLTLDSSCHEWEGVDV
jgi:hypothetical protein